MSEHLRFDEHEDLICSLEHAAGTARAVSAQPYQWKWLLLSLHSALQGAMICALGGNAGTSASTEKMGKDEGTRDRSEATQPEEWLARPAKLFAECQKRGRMSESGGQPLSLTASQIRSFAFLDELRKEFVHFRPIGWSIEKARLIEATSEVLQILDQLVSHPAIQNQLTKDQRDRLSDAIGQIRHWLH